MSFLSGEDRAARRRIFDGQKPLPHGEIVANSVIHAHQELPVLLASIKGAYRSESYGWNFIYDLSDARRPTMDAQVVVEEMARLVRKATGLECKLDGSNRSSRASFGISF